VFPRFERRTSRSVAPDGIAGTRSARRRLNLISGQSAEPKHPSWRWIRPAVRYRASPPDQNGAFHAFPVERVGGRNSPWTAWRQIGCAAAAPERNHFFRIIACRSLGSGRPRVPPGSFGSRPLARRGSFGQSYPEQRVVRMT